MDRFETVHLENWLYWNRREDEREKTKSLIVEFCNQNPEVLQRNSWPEIVAMAEATKPGNK